MQPAAAKPQNKIYYNAKTGQYLYYNSNTKQYHPWMPPQLHAQHGTHQVQRPSITPHSTRQLHRPQQPVQQSFHSVQPERSPSNTFQRFQLTPPQKSSSKLREDKQKHSSQVVNNENLQSIGTQHQKRYISGHVPQTRQVPSSQTQHIQQPRHSKHEQQQVRYLKKEEQGSRSTSEHTYKAGTSTSGLGALSVFTPKCDSSTVNCSPAQLLPSISPHEISCTFSATHTSKAERDTKVTQFDGKNKNLPITKPEQSKTLKNGNVLQHSPNGRVEDAEVTSDLINASEEKFSYSSCFNSLHVGSLCIPSGPAHLNKGPKNLNKGASVSVASSSCVPSGSQKLNLGPAQLAKGPFVVTVGPNKLFCGPAGFSKGPAGIASGSYSLPRSSSSNFVGPTVIPTGPSSAIDLVVKTSAVGSSNMAKGPSCLVRGSIKNAADACKVELVRG